MTGLDPRLADRLARVGLRTPEQIRAYLDRFPAGGEAIGRVDVQDVRDWLDAQTEESE